MRAAVQDGKGTVHDHVVHGLSPAVDVLVSVSRVVDDEAIGVFGNGEYVREELVLVGSWGVVVPVPEQRRLTR
jgi:hypothetical protein